MSYAHYEMFRGATKLTVDDKGRVVMPTRHRDRLREQSAGRVVVTVDRDQCLLPGFFSSHTKTYARIRRSVETGNGYFLIDQPLGY